MRLARWRRSLSDQRYAATSLEYPRNWICRASRQGAALTRAGESIAMGVRLGGQSASQWLRWNRLGFNRKPDRSPPRQGAPRQHSSVASGDGRSHARCNRRHARSGRHIDWAQPASQQPRARDRELRPPAVAADVNVGRWIHGRVTQRAGPIAIQPDLRRNCGNFFGQTLWAGHSTHLDRQRATVAAARKIQNSWKSQL